MQKLRKVKEYGATGKSLKRKKFCKFTKGEHKFTLFKEYPKIMKEGSWKEYRCELCGKLKFEW